MAPKVTEAHSAARKEQILMAAMNCFASKGFHKTTIQDVCKTAQMSPGAVYSYFDSKDAIIEALCKVGEEMNNNLFEFANKQDYASPQGAFTSALSLFISQYKSPMFQTSARMDALFLAEALHNCDLAEIGAKSYHNILNQAQQMVENAQQAGHLDPKLEPKAVAQVMFSLVQGLGTQLLMGGQNAGSNEADAYLEAVLAMINGRLFVPDQSQE